MTRTLSDKQLDRLYEANEAAQEAMNTEPGIDEILAGVTPVIAQAEFERLTNGFHDD